MTFESFHSRRVSLGVPVIDQISKAVKKGDEEAFRQLISLFQFNETSNNLNQLDSDGSHPLHLAVKYRRMKMLRTMLHYKNSLNLDVCITDFDGQSAMDVAIMNKNHEALHKLVKHGASAGLAVPFEELKLQLLECPPRTDHREALLAGASCRSEVALHSEAVCTDYPYDARRPARHLLHPISGTHWRSDICEMAVQKCYHDLTKYMDPSLILPILVSAGHLSLECAERIHSHQTKGEQTMQLLSLLRRCSRNGYQGLFKALKEEKEHKAHQELLEQLEDNCEIIQRTRTALSSRGSGGIDASQEDLEKVTTIYHGDYPGTPNRHQRPLETSLELSDRTESGIYSATSSVGRLPGTHSSGRLSTPLSRRSTSSNSLTRPQSRRKRIPVVQDMPSVLVRGKVNHRASSNFRALDERSPRASLDVINAVVKRERAPVHEMMSLQSDTNRGAGDVSAAAVCGRPLPVQATPFTHYTRAHSTCTLDESLDDPLFVSSVEPEEGDTERDSSGVFKRSSPTASPTASPPINIPLRIVRNESYTTLPSPQRSELARSPQNLLLRQISCDNASSDSNSSDIIRLDAPSQPKDLSHIRPARRTLFGLLKSLKAKFSANPDSNETRSGASNQSRNSYSYGCGVRM